MGNTVRIVCGRHAVKAALAAGTVQALWLGAGTNQDLVAKAKKSGLKAEIVSTRRLNQLANTTKHQGIVAQCREVATATGWRVAVATANNPLVLVLDQIQDPHNLGACLRSAAAFGVDAVIYPKRNSVGLTPAVRKVAAGAEEFVTIEAVSNLARELQAMQQLGITVIGTVIKDAIAIDQIDLRGPVAIVLGGEAQGLRELTKNNCDVLTTIPMENRQQVASLNVAVACGICLAAVGSSRRSPP